MKKWLCIIRIKTNLRNVPFVCYRLYLSVQMIIFYAQIFGIISIKMLLNIGNRNEIIGLIYIKILTVSQLYLKRNRGT